MHLQYLQILADFSSCDLITDLLYYCSSHVPLNPISAGQSVYVSSTLIQPEQVRILATMFSGVIDGGQGGRNAPPPGSSWGPRAEKGAPFFKGNIIFSGFVAVSNKARN